MARPMDVRPPDEAESNFPIRFLPIPKPRGGKYQLLDETNLVGDVGDFYMAETPITVGQWGEFPSEKTNHFGNNPNLPREKISWDEAKAYCEAITVEGYTCRLPTEYEWEWAALGGEGFTYKIENGVIQVIGSCTNLDKIAWYGEWFETGSTKEVKRKKSNGYGLYDIIGNVFEWTNSLPEDSTDQGADRFFRGGSWDFFPTLKTAAFRYHYAPGFRVNFLGVRPVLVKS